jgi:hypothetical protein
LACLLLGLPHGYIKDANNKNRDTFIVGFSMGRKFSLFQAEFLKASFEPVVRRKIECTITDNNV